MGQLTNTDMWLVVHTPKTAGTSLRWALEKHFGKSQVILDYGPHSDVTSDVVRKHLYNEDDSKGPQSLVEEISNNGNKVLVGHFPLQRYGNCFEAKNIITFVRDPLVRTCSEYLHRTNNKTFTGTFSEFVKRPGYRNLQSRFLKGSSEDVFIGVTEYYAESLQRINRMTSWNLKTGKKNMGRRGGGQKFVEKLSEHERHLFYRMNKQDEALYQLAIRRFATLGN